MSKLVIAVLSMSFLFCLVLSAEETINDSNVCKPADVSFYNHNVMDLQKEYSPAHAKAASGNRIWAIMLGGRSTKACLIPLAGNSLVVNVKTEEGYRQFRSSAIDSDEQLWIENNNFTTRHLKPVGFRVAIIVELPDSLSPIDSNFFIQLPLLAYEKSTEN